MFHHNAQLLLRLILIKIERQGISYLCELSLATSSFHHHVSLCLGGPFVHPHTCSVAFCHTSFIAFYLLSTLSVSNTSSFLSVTNRANSCFTLGSLSFHTFSLGMCILFFFLGAELMTTSPTSDRKDAQSRNKWRRRIKRATG